MKVNDIAADLPKEVRSNLMDLLMNRLPALPLGIVFGDAALSSTEAAHAKTICLNELTGETDLPTSAVKALPEQERRFLAHGMLQELIPVLDLALVLELVEQASDGHIAAAESHARILFRDQKASAGNTCRLRILISDAMDLVKEIPRKILVRMKERIVVDFFGKEIPIVDSQSINFVLALSDDTAHLKLYCSKTDRRGLRWTFGYIDEKKMKEYAGLFKDTTVPWVDVHSNLPLSHACPGKIGNKFYGQIPYLIRLYSLKEISTTVYCGMQDIQAADYDSYETRLKKLLYFDIMRHSDFFSKPARKVGNKKLMHEIIYNLQILSVYLYMLHDDNRYVERNLEEAFDNVGVTALWEIDEAHKILETTKMKLPRDWKLPAIFKGLSHDDIERAVVWVSLRDINFGYSRPLLQTACISYLYGSDQADSPEALHAFFKDRQIELGNFFNKQYMGFAGAVYKMLRESIYFYPGMGDVPWNVFLAMTYRDAVRSGGWSGGQDSFVFSRFFIALAVDSLMRSRLGCIEVMSRQFEKKFFSALKRRMNLTNQKQHLGSTSMNNFAKKILQEVNNA